MVKRYDISPELSSRTAVFPGDQPLEQRVSMHVDHGDHISLSAILTTVHLGAHADAPVHYRKGGGDIATRSLDYYLGLAQVISVTKGPKERIVLGDLKGQKIKAPRVLFKTKSFEDPNQWKDDFVACSAELLRYLASEGVKLVGIDTPSIDLSDSKSLESHQVVADNDMAILEGLVLTQVPDGLYTLVALPLKLKNADASPVRAILVDADLGLG